MATAGMEISLSPQAWSHGRGHCRHGDLSVAAGMESWPWSLQAWRSLCRRRHGAMNMAIAGMEPWPWLLQVWRSLCRRRHGAMAVATAGMEISLSPQAWSHEYGHCRHGAMAVATAGIEISVTRQHCREKAESEIYLLSFFSLVKQVWRERSHGYGHCR